MEKPSYFLERAEQCRRLAAAFVRQSDPAAAALRALATEFEAKASASPKSQCAEKTGEEATGTMVRASILVLEDDDSLRHFLVRTLQDADYSVVSTGDANEAIKLLGGDTAFDLLIAEIVMPIFQPHGIAVGKMARNLQPQIKIIYIAADPGQVPSGFIDVTETPLLGKPLDVDTLLTTVAAALAARM
jgi:CheY-like chemotaxis protein